MKYEIRNLKSASWNPKTEFWHMKIEIRNLKSEVWHPKSEIWSRKFEFWKPKTESWTLKSEIWTLKPEIWDPKAESWNQISEMWDLELEVGYMKYEVRNMKPEIRKRILGVAYGAWVCFSGLDFFLVRIRHKPIWGPLDSILCTPGVHFDTPWLTRKWIVNLNMKSKSNRKE